MNDLIIQPVVQYGFLGFSAVLLVVVIWLIRRLLILLEQTSRIIAGNTEAIERLNTRTSETLEVTRSLRDIILTKNMTRTVRTVLPSGE